MGTRTGFLETVAVELVPTPMARATVKVQRLARGRRNFSDRTCWWPRGLVGGAWRQLRGALQGVPTVLTLSLLHLFWLFWAWSVVCF